MDAAKIEREKLRYDPVLLEVFFGATTSIAEEIGAVVLRTAYSNVIGDSQDYSSAVLDADLEIIAQGSHQPLHIGVIAEAAKQMIPEVGPLEEGDIIISNDPFMGGTHLPDVILFQPVFYSGEIIGFSSNLAHWADIGGRALGGMSCDATEVYQEGLRIPAMKLFDRGRLNDTLIKLVSHNVRLSEEVIGDLFAQVAGCRAGAQGLLELVEKYSLDTVRTYFRHLKDYSERVMRNELAKFRDGTYKFEDCLDDDGITSNPVWIRCALTIKGSEVCVDFSGSDPQPAGPFSLTLASTKSCVYYALNAVSGLGIPFNEGCYRPVSVVALEGSVVNAILPASTGPRAATALRVVDVLFGALSQAVPERVPAASHGNVLGIRIWGRDRAGKWFGFNDGLPGGAGGGPNRDGMDACSAGILNGRDRSVEILEDRYPVLFERYELIPDSGGAGEFRGGLGLWREFRMLENGYLVLRNERHKFAPYGLFGGKPGRKSAALINGRLPPSQKITHLPISKGDVITLLTPGGGGWGNPKARDPILVHEDVMDEKISPEFARAEYGHE